MVLWCLCLLVFSLLNKEGGGFILNNVYNAYRVFVPYLVFAAFAWKIAQRKTYRQLMCMAAVIPLLWGVFFTLFYLVVSFLAERTVEKWYILGMMAFWACLVAYLIELIPFTILAAFKDDFKADSPASD